MNFTDEEFSRVVGELQKPILDDYEFFVESNDVKVYRQYEQNSGLYHYKVIGNINVSPEVCADVYMDLDYRKTWDTYANELYYVSKDEPEVVYWEVSYPWPMSNRDYVYMRQKKVVDFHGNSVWVILGRSVMKGDVPEDQMIPVKDGVYRVDDFVQSMAITSDGKGGTRAFMQYFDNPKGSIPTWLINWAASTGVPDFLSKMENACNGYQAYKSL